MPGCCAGVPVVAGAAEPVVSVAFRSEEPPDLAVVVPADDIAVGLAAFELLERHGIASMLVTLGAAALHDERRHPTLEPAVPVGFPRLVLESGSPHCWRGVLGPGDVVVRPHAQVTEATDRSTLASHGFAEDALCAAASDILTHRSIGW